MTLSDASIIMVLHAMIVVPMIERATDEHFRFRRRWLFDRLYESIGFSELFFFLEDCFKIDLDLLSKQIN